MNEPTSNQEFETGLLQRIRSWREVFPPLVMLPALRVCGSPVYVGLSLVTTILIAALFQDDWPQLAVPKPSLDVPQIPMVLNLSIAQSWRQFAAVIIACLPAAVMIRAGALCAAGRDGESSLENIKFIGERAQPLLLVLVLPVICVAGLCVPIGMLALLDRIPGIGNGMTEVLGILVVPFAILIGLIAAGSTVAVPLGWASVAIEKRQDPFDALSRGFEYLYRRPVQTLIYFSISFILASLLKWFALWVAYAAASIAGVVYGYGSGGETLPKMIIAHLVYLPPAVFMTTLAATLGAVYLMLRHDANQQEIEDVVVSEIDQNRNQLPTLRDKPTPDQKSS